MRLEGEGAEHFDVVLSDDGTQATLTMKSDVAFEKGKSYRLQLVFRIRGVDVATNITVKIEQSALTLGVGNMLNLYQSSTVLNCRMKVSAPVGATVDSVTLSDKTTAQFGKALAEEGMTWKVLADGTVLVSFRIHNAARLNIGKTYTIYLDVTPVGNASNVKPIQVRLNVKVSK